MLVNFIKKQSTLNYQNIGMKMLSDYSKKNLGKYNEENEELIRSKSIFTNNLWAKSKKISKRDLRINKIFL